MARILYALSGEGMGHAIRSKTVIEALQKDHKVLVACGGRAYKYLKGHFDSVIPMQSLYITYHNNSVSSLRTLFRNIRNLPSHFRSIWRILGIMRKFNPDIIINDFDYITNYLAILMGIPNIMIDNQQMIVKSRIKFSKKLRWDFIKSWMIVRFVAPAANFSFINSFFFPKLKVKNAAYCLPVVRDEVRKANAGNKDYILVYQTSNTNKKLLRVLQKSGHWFKIYGFSLEKTDGNLEFKRFNEKGFIKDLAGSKGVIINGGFTVMSEALYLRKPVLSIPIEKQFEQVLNAIYLSRLGYGMNAQKVSRRILEEFIGRIPEFNERLKSYPQYGNELFFDKLNAKIDLIVKKK